MHRTQTKRITLAVLCALPLAAQAEEVPSTQDGLKLKPERSLLSPPQSRDDTAPVFIEADRLRGHSEKETEAEGNVQLRRSGQFIFSDRLRFESAEQELEASGNVRLEQQGDVLQGEYLRFNLGTERGFMDKPVFKLTPIPPTPAPGVRPSPGSVAGIGPLSTPRPGELESRGDADRMRFLGPDLYRMEQASYTTCGPGNDDWFIRANELDIDKNRDVGVARGASIVFMDQTIFYTPYISFPLHQQRKSGFLAPHYGTASTTGTEFTQPYYWNIAPNLDATFSPRVMTKRGLQLGSEFRYLEPSYRGEARVEILPGDREAGRDRWAYFLKHTQSFANGWSGALNLNRVSDANYFTDLSTLISLTSQATLPNEATLSHGGTWGQGSYSFSALGQQWQTLQNDPLAPITPPYNRLPQLTWSGFRQDILKSDLDVQSSFVAFNHPTLVNGQRVLAYPSLSLPLQTSYAYFTPKVGMHASHYFVGANDQGFQSQTRTLPIFTADTGLIFDRETRFLGRAYNQTLEPKLYYVYIPFRDQSRIPNFESGLQDVSFATIFSENQFSGSDRINDANQVTVGVTSRFIEPESGVERLRVALAQRYYFAGQRVTLPGVPPRPDHTNSSDLLAGVSATILPKWTIETGWQYTTDTNQTQKANLATRYQPAARKVLNLAYRSDTLNLIKQTDMSFQWPVTSQWTAVGRWNYSILDKRTLEALAGFEYDAGCWQFRAVGHRFATAVSTASTSFFLQLELNGVSRIGSNPLDVLRRNIGGYTPNDPRAPRTDEYFVP